MAPKQHMNSLTMSNEALVLKEKLKLKKKNLNNEMSGKILTCDIFIPYIPIIAQKLNSRIGAIFLQQLHYWQTQKYGKFEGNKRWIFNTYEAWAEQLSCSVSNIRKIVSKLEAMGLIETRIEWAQRGKNYLRKWYTINYQSLYSLNLEIEHAGSKEKSTNANLKRNLNCKLALKLENRQVNNVTLSSKKLPLNLCHEVSLSSSSNNRDNKIINNLSPTCVEPIYQNMISIWNELVHQGSKAVRLTERRLKWLKRRFKVEFKSCIEKWKEYCSLIANNDFLMGMGKRGWKATLDWAIMPHNIQKVLANTYQYLVRERKNDSKEKPVRSQAEIEAEKAAIEASIQETLKTVDESAHPQYWKEICTKLIPKIGTYLFKEYILPLEPQLIQDGNFKHRKFLMLKSPSPTISIWDTHHQFSLTIWSICEQLGLSIRSVDFTYTPVDPLLGQVNEVIQRELEGSKIEMETQETIKQIESSHQPVFWKDVCKHLISKLGIGKFKNWIPQLTFQNKYHDTVVLKAASQRSLIWLKRNFSESIVECCQKLDPKIRYLEFTCE